MPGGDGTGPMGMGPMTGRAAGYCAGYAVPGCMNGTAGRGRGAGGGRGRRRWFSATGMNGFQRAAMGMAAFGGPFQERVSFKPMNKDEEVDALKRQAEALGSQLEAIRRKIEEMASSGE